MTNEMRNQLAREHLYECLIRLTEWISNRSIVSHSRRNVRLGMFKDSLWVCLKQVYSINSAKQDYPV